ncbi:MAG: isoleucine--tRNA ligase [Bacillota bacterium]|nr:isoleucine--tRNA ligase [Bacillota bacterium]
MYQKVPTGMDFGSREAQVAEFWKRESIQERSRAARAGGQRFTIYDGPPTANGRPHIGHVLTRVVKDIIPRYHTMKGRDVEFKAGWDTHGLPVELEVEKDLGINGKPEIEAYGVEPFIECCKHSVWTYKDEWERISERIAFWADMENAYVTYDNSYIESEWWALKKIHELGLLYEGHKIIPYCPRCGTSLSSHEVAQGYRDVSEDTVYLRFAVCGEPGTWLTAWTTTPWTLPSNAALCVNPEARYVLARRGQDRYYVAADRAEAVLGQDYEVLDTFVGSELVGIDYEPLFPYARDLVAKSGRRAWYVIADDYVTTGDGTGIVHIAPAFGEDDARLGREFELPHIQFVAEDGTLTDEVTDFAGRFVKDADPDIVAKLEADGLLLGMETVEHSYPFCWRCDTALIYYARHGWFIRMTTLRDQLVANNRSVNWLPPTIRDGRMGNFLEGVIDWALSRERYWGTPLPVWRCAEGHVHVVGSIAELREMSDNCPPDIELHRPWIDAVTIRCPECSGEMRRVPEVIDCWFDSGAMPFAQYHYPFENQELFEKNFPAQFISEALDQTRGWFYSLQAISTAIFGRSPYENVIVMGLVQDRDGQKMSKHKGNVVDPWEVLDRYGADATRWYFLSGTQLWLSARFTMEAVEEGQRKFMGTLWNTYAFYIMYAEIDQFNPTGLRLEDQELTRMDRWILSRLNRLVAVVDRGLDSYDITGSGRRIQAFVEELSNWYVRSGRERFWGPDMTADKRAAFLTLYTVLETVCRLAAPYVPYITEQIYQNLVCQVNPGAVPSVHMTDFPTSDPKWIDEKLEAGIDEVLELVGLGRAARQERQVKTRQPLAEMLVVSPVRLEDEDRDLLLAELNVKQLRYVDSAAELVDYRFRPQLRTLGRRLGALVPKVQAALAALDGRAAKRRLDETGALELDIEGASVRLEADDLLIDTVPLADFATTGSGERTVALNLRLSRELIEEGLVRELVSKIQTMRRDSDFEVTDRIRVLYDAGSDLTSVITRHAAAVQAATLTRELEQRPGLEGGTDWEINGHPCRLVIEP